jgi:Protein of unknown function (DUF4013)
MATQALRPGGTLDFARSFTFVTEDPDWIKKVLIGGAFTLLSALLVGIPFVLGYFARTLGNVASGVQRPLPEWDDLGGLFQDGLRVAAVYLVYVVGGMLVAAIPGCMLMLPAMIASASSRGSEAAAALAAVGMIAFYGLMLLFSLALVVFVPAALTQVAIRGTVSGGFAWRRAIDFIRLNVGNYLLSLVSFLVAGFVAQFGILLCCVGMFPAAFWSYLVLAAALGQTVRLNPNSVA